MKTSVYTESGTKSTETIELPKEVFEQKNPSMILIKQAYESYLSGIRSAQAKTLKRGEVRGGGRKPWRQKGTGRARVGSSRSPIWRGGGITFGPTGKQNFTHKINRKSKKTALRHALSLKNKSNEIGVVSKFPVKEGKTKEIVTILDKLKLTKNLLIVVNKDDTLVRQASRNIHYVEVSSTEYLTVYKIMNADYILFSKSSIASLVKQNGESNA